MNNHNYVERFLLPFFFVLSIMYAFHSCRGEGVQLTKAYHHKAPQPTFLEHANLVLYFSKTPSMTVVEENKSFFFPDVAIAKECENMIHTINANRDGHVIMIRYVTQPRSGILITFDVQKDNCSLVCQTFDSIHADKGIIFRLYNKNMIHTIEMNTDKSILQTASLQKKPCIIIDSGHGGSDTGTHGLSPLYEKEITLAIGQEVAHLLDSQGYTALLTRTSDYNVSLDKRTTYAHQNGAHLFISIHGNYARRASICGVETFYCAPYLFTDLYSYLSPYERQKVAHIFTQRARDSGALAQLIQKKICAAIAEYHTMPVDRHVKQAASQVLMGTQLPSVLVEVGFLSNQREAALLNTSEYRHIIAQAICDGIISYLLL